MRVVMPLPDLLIFCGLLLLQASLILSSSIYIKTNRDSSTNHTIDDSITNSKNLSDLIEYIDDPSYSFPGAINPEGVTKNKDAIFKIRVKAHLIVGNNQNQNPEVHISTISENRYSTKPSETDSNSSENPLDGIEYIDDGFLFPSQIDTSTESADMEDIIIHPLSKRFAYLNEEVSRNTDFFVEDKQGKEDAVSNQSKESDKNDNFRSSYASGRQFVFHPYLPHEKDIPPDEKITFHDILPVKMVKFIKSMVEEAPWEQMFMKMVRMVVDQFVDKIIEKMFADKDHHGRDSWKPWEIILTPIWKIRDLRTPIVRLRRAVGKTSTPDQDEDVFLFTPKPLQELEVIKKKSPEERKTLLDHILDAIFPVSSEKQSYLEHFKKRDTSYDELKEVLTNVTLQYIKRFLLLYSGDLDVYRNASENDNASPSSFKDYAYNDLGDSSENRIEGATSRRTKRSASEEVLHNEERLWQSSARPRPHKHRSRDDCSLRKACTAGRLLSRLPSVHEIMLQLRSYENEPHWEAFLWGMKKKRCSRVFCKRQRSPKGSRHAWNFEKQRANSKVQIVTELPDNDDMDNIMM